MGKFCSFAFTPLETLPDSVQTTLDRVELVFCRSAGLPLGASTLTRLHEMLRSTVGRALATDRLDPAETHFVDSRAAKVARVAARFARKAGNEAIEVADLEQAIRVVFDRARRAEHRAAV